MSKIVRGERKAKTRFQALLSRSRFSRRSLKDRVSFVFDAAKVGVFFEG
jgi:hypothetical protein